MNQRREVVRYNRFRVKPTMQEGLLPVHRAGGDLERRTASALFRAAGQFGAIADRQAAHDGRLAGEQAAIAGAPKLTLSGGLPLDEPTGDYQGGAVGQVIEQEAEAEGVDPDALKTVAWLESRFNPDAKNPKSSAEGLFQFLDGTASAYGLTNKRDAKASANAAARLMRDNAAAFRKAFGRDANRGELYLMHQQGAGGGIKLLKNADKPATSIVGAKAVKLNGGTADMTAGEFANLWIRKAGSEPAAVAPVRIDVDGGSFRPSRRNTIRGRAFDEAGMRTYLQFLDTEIRATAAQAYELHRDNPAELEKVYSTLAKEQLKEHVFDEVEADYATTFHRVTSGYMLQARKNVLTRQRQEDRAAFIERTTELEGQQQSQIEALDPDAVDTAEQIASAQAAIDDHYDDAVRRGILAPDDAAKAKIASRRNAALGFYGRQAETKSADDVRAMREAMEADFADGGIDGLDGESWRTLETRLTALEKRKRREDKSARADLRKRGDAMAGRLLMGFDVDQAELGKLILDSKTAPGGADELEETMAKIGIGRAMRDLPLPEARKHLDAMRKGLGDQPTDAEIRTLAMGETMLRDKQKALATDPVTYAERTGVIEPTGNLTDADTPADMGALLERRIAEAESAAEHFDIRPRYLKAGEAAAISAMIKADPETGAAMAGALVEGAGDRANDVLREFGQDGPLVLEAGAIIAAGGSARAAQDVVGGYDKEAKVKLKPSAERQNAERVMERSLLMQPDDARRIGRAAAAITRKRLTEEGIDRDSAEALDIHEQAIHEAAGGTFIDGVQFGGFADYDTGWFSSERVLVPSAVLADRFDDVIGAVRDEDLEVRPVGGVGSLAGKTPVAINGGYVFFAGSRDDPKFVQADDGRLFILDIEPLLPTLAPRVPGTVRAMP